MGRGHESRAVEIKMMFGERVDLKQERINMYLTKLIAVNRYGLILKNQIPIPKYWSYFSYEFDSDTSQDSHFNIFKLINPS